MCQKRQTLLKCPPEHYWKIVFSSVDLNESPKFSNLQQVISMLLCLPFSNAPAERTFSTMKLTKTPCRNQLDDNTMSSLISAKTWLKNQKSTAGNVNIPEDLIKAAKKVKSNAAIP